MLDKILGRLQRNRQLSVLKKHPNIFVGSIQLGIENHFTLHKNLKNVTIGNAVSFRNFAQVLVHENASLRLGDNFFMNSFCSINCLENISIGNNTLFGENVKLYDHNHAHEIHPEFKVHRNTFNTSPIKIGDNCWLGSNVTVLKGVTIGNSCIIGAGCTIYESVPSNTILVNKQELISKPLK